MKANVPLLRALMNQYYSHLDLDLAAQNERLQLALQAAEVGTWDYNLLTGQAEWSTICKQLFGLPPDAAVNAAILLEQVHPDDRERVGATNTQTLRSPGNGDHDVTFRTLNPDGVLRWVQAKGKTFCDEQGKIVRFSGIVQDVTQQVIAREQIQTREEQYRALSSELDERVQQRTVSLNEANRDLKRSNENLAQFAYIASHDLQEPLRKIQSFSTLLDERYRTVLDDDGRDLLNRLSVAGNRMSILIRDLLAFSRISTQQVALKQVSLNETLLCVVDTLSQAIEESHTQIVIEDLPVVQGDYVQLEQLFQNLLSNAIKFRQADTQPQIQIKARHVKAEDLPERVHPTRHTASYHCISVSDNGIGFDEKYRDRIFQVFQRLHGKQKFVGTGIGLAICEKVVANHGGAITATSQPGQGATFWVYLPA